MSDLHTRVAARAYFMAEAAGWPEGQQEAHWLAAEAVERLAESVERAEAHHGLADTVFGADRAAKRRAAALKGAATRKANRDAKREASSRAVASILGRGTAPDAATGATAH